MQPKKRVIPVILVIILCMALTVVYANDSKVSMNLEPLHVENQGENVLYKAVEPLKHVNDSLLFDLNRSIVNITPSDVVINDSNDNITADSNVSDVDNGVSDNDISSVEVVEPEPVVNYKTVYGKPSSWLDSGYSYRLYKVVYDWDLAESYYGHISINPKGVPESELTTDSDIDFSIFGNEKSQYDYQFAHPKSIAGAIISIEVV